MTKLDGILQRLRAGLNIEIDKDVAEAKAALKAVMLDLVGEDEPDTGTYKGSTYKKLHARNKLRDELRKEIVEL